MIAFDEDAFIGSLNDELIPYPRQLKGRIRVAALTNNGSVGRDRD